MHESQRAVAEQLCEFRKTVSLTRQQFQDLIARHHGGRKLAEWVPVIFDFYRRLELLAENAASSSQEARKLAEEASRYVTQHRIKGICVADEANRLANLLDRQ